MYENTGVTRVSWRHCINLQSLSIPLLNSYLLKMFTRTLANGRSGKTVLRIAGWKVLLCGNVYYCQDIALHRKALKLTSVHYFCIVL